MSSETMKRSGRELTKDSNGPMGRGREEEICALHSDEIQFSNGGGERERCVCEEEEEGEGVGGREGGGRERDDDDDDDDEGEVEEDDDEFCFGSE